MIGPRCRALPSTTLVAWNVCGFRPRAQEVDDLFQDSAVSLAFLSETMQAKRHDGTVIPLDFQGTRISMPGVKLAGTAGHASMGIAFVAKTTHLKRIASLQCPRARWQMLVVETERLRFIGVYMRPKSQRAEWLQFLGKLNQYKAKSRPTIVCGDFNAHHPDWTRGKTDAGGTALRAFVSKGLAARSTAHCLTQFTMNAPDSATCVRQTPRGVSQSTIDLFLTSNLRAFTAGKARVYFSHTAGGSDHAAIALTICAPCTPKTRPTKQFLPTPHRRSNLELRAAAIQSYEQRLPDFAYRFDQCSDKDELAVVYEEFVLVVQAPWMTMAAARPARFRPGWTRQLDGIAKERARQTRRQFGRNVSADDKLTAVTESRRLSALIRRLLKQQRYEQREAVAAQLRQAAEERNTAASRSQ